MKLNNIKFILPLFIAIFSASSYGFTDAIELDERMSLNIEPADYFQKATYNISYPGSDAWLDNGKFHVTDKMPACLIVVSGNDSLDAKQLEKFINELDVTTRNERKLPLESYKGTWTFVDRDPFNSSFIDTPYIIKTKNNLTFGQLLQYVGGTQDSRVSIYFDRGCADLATRAYLPEQANIQVKTDLTKFDLKSRKTH